MQAAGRHITCQVILLSGLSCFCADGGVTPTTSHVGRTKALLLEVARHQGAQDPALAFNDLLQGATQVLLLLEFGVVLGRGSARAAASAGAGSSRGAAGDGADGRRGSDEAVGKKLQYLRALAVLVMLLGQHLKHHVLQLTSVLSEALECAVHQQVQRQGRGRCWVVPLCCAPFPLHSIALLHTWHTTVVRSACLTMSLRCFG